MHPLVIRPVEILRIADDLGDARLMREVLYDATVPNGLRLGRDGVETLAILHCEVAHAALPHPDPILLDLTMSRADGWEVLAEIKADRSLPRILVGLFTASAAEQDLRRAYDLHAIMWSSQSTGSNSPLPSGRPRTSGSRWR